MSKNAVKRFRAMVEPLEGGLGWVVARIPFDVDAAWKKMVRLRVKVEVGGKCFGRRCLRIHGEGGTFCW